MKRVVSGAGLIGLVMLLPTCGGDDPADGGSVEEVAGFRIVEGSTTRFEWIEGDNAAADTLNLTHSMNMTVRFEWLDGARAVANVPDDAELEVAISNSGAAEFIPDDSQPWRGTFDPGPFTDIETAMRVRLLDDGDTLFASPLLQLHVSP